MRLTYNVFVAMTNTCVYERILYMNIFIGILIPFLGTSLGAACVFFMKRGLSDLVQRSLTGFASWWRHPSGAF